MEKKIYGLSMQEVEEKRKKGEGEQEPESITKSKKQIIRENVLTLFNLLNFIIAGLLFAVGAYTNMIFIAIIILNIVIGIAQECKAKKLVDELSILNRPAIKVRREGEDQEIELKDIVKGDIVILESGSQICNDSIVTSGSLEVNESLLTGESDPVIKEVGSTLYSGSSVISGKACAEVIHVGNDNYATSLVNEVKKEKQVQSELLGSMRKVTRFTSSLIIPLGILLFLEAFVLRKAPVNESVVASAAALLGVLPKGLVLLISVSLATGVIRLAKMKILVQNIYSLETLAHVDVLCLDKTGTITDGKLKVKYVIPMDRDEEINLTEDEEKQLVRAYLDASDDNNATFQALKKAFAEKKSEEKNVEEKNIRYKEKNIADVLDMRVDEAIKFFENVPKIKNKLQVLHDVGLGYVKLGQSATTLSGGEAGRVKLAKELQKKATGKTLFIDARKMGTMVSRKLRELTEEDIDKIADTYKAFVDGTLEEIKGFCAAVDTTEIEKQDYILTPGRYVGIEEQEDDGEPFEQKMNRLISELSELFAKSHELEDEIRKKLGAIGYEV